MELDPNIFIDVINTSNTKITQLNYYVFKKLDTYYSITNGYVYVYERVSICIIKMS